MTAIKGPFRVPVPCESCGEDVFIGAEKCRHCQAPLSWPEISDSDLEKRMIKLDPHWGRRLAELANRNSSGSEKKKRQAQLPRERRDQPFSLATYLTFFLPRLVVWTVVTLLAMKFIGQWCSLAGAFMVVGSHLRAANVAKGEID